MSKMFFIEYLPIVKSKSVPNQKYSEFTKIWLIAISNMPISILMTKIIFVKNLPPARPKFVPKLKVPRIY